MGAVIAPVVGALGNSELALAVVMTVGVVIALVALLAVGKVGASGHERRNPTVNLFRSRRIRSVEAVSGGGAGRETDTHTMQMPILTPIGPFTRGRRCGR